MAKEKKTKEDKPDFDLIIKEMKKMKEDAEAEKLEALEEAKIIKDLKDLDDAIETLPVPIVAPSKKEKLKKDEIRLNIDGKSILICKDSIFQIAKKEYKLKEDKKRILNGEVAVLYLRKSMIGEIKYVKPENDMFIIEGKYYHVRESCIFSIGNKRLPLAIIPEWAFVPVSESGWREKLGGENQEAQTLIIKSLENAEIVKINADNQPRAKPNGKLIIGIIVAAVVVIYFLSKSAGAA